MTIVAVSENGRDDSKRERGGQGGTVLGSAIHEEVREGSRNKRGEEGCCHV